VARRTAEEAAETRRTIVDAARELFAEKGYAATPTAEVVERAGVTRGALYHHFADKTDLLRAVFVAIENELNDAGLTRAGAESDPLAAVLAGARAAMEFQQRPDYRQVALVDARAALGEAEWHRLDAAIGLASMELGLAVLHESGQLAVAPSRALATVLFGALTEAGLAAARGDGEIDELLGAFALLIDRLGPGAGDL
jgi:AcrR family transcriptional regulator